MEDDFCNQRLGPRFFLEQIEDLAIAYPLPLSFSLSLLKGNSCVCFVQCREMYIFKGP